MNHKNCYENQTILLNKVLIVICTLLPSLIHDDQNISPKRKEMKREDIIIFIGILLLG